MMRKDNKRPPRKRKATEMMIVSDSHVRELVVLARITATTGWVSVLLSLAAVSLLVLR
jgi:hypothetical protein